MSTSPSIRVPGDVILLGNTSWRVQRIEAAGQVHVEDAHGAPPSVPFWTGEAPQRTDVLSDGVSESAQRDLGAHGGCLAGIHLGGSA